MSLIYNSFFFNFFKQGFLILKPVAKSPPSERKKISDGKLEIYICVTEFVAYIYSSAESAEIVKELRTQRGLRFSKANSKAPG